MLRTSYSRAKKLQADKQPSGSGAPTKSPKPWPFYESMRYLDDVMEPCEEVVSIPISGSRIERANDVKQVERQNEDTNKYMEIYNSDTESYSEQFVAEEITLQKDEDLFVRPRSEPSFFEDSLPSPSCSNDSSNHPPIQRSTSSSELQSKRKKSNNVQEESKVFF